MAEDKTLLKKDLGLVIKLNSKLHYNNIEEVKKIYQTLVEKKMFVSSLGQRYLKKLELIIQGKNNNTCLFCGKQCTAQSVICSECLGKMQPQNEVKPQTEKVSTIKEATIKEMPVSENIDEQTKTVQDKGKNKKKSIIKIAVILVVAIILISIGLDTIFTILMLVSLGFLIYNGIKKKPKRNAAIAFVIFFILTGITAMFETDSNTYDVLNYLGTPQSEVFEDYSADNFYSVYNMLTNEGKIEDGKPYVTMTSNGNVCEVILESGMNSSLNVVGVHIGDSMVDMRNLMDEANVEYDTEYSIPSVLETYRLKYENYNVQIIIRIQDGRITRISCTTNDVK